MRIISPVTRDYLPAASNIWGGSWFNANPYLQWYEINTTTHLYNYHTGVDLNNNKPYWNADNHSPLYAITDGEVVFSGAGGGTWGWIIVIKHVSDAGQVFCSRYAHIEKPLVKTGDIVVVGQQIASVGSGDPDGDGPARGAYEGGREHFHFDISYGDLLVKKPNHWPGQDRAAVLAFYADPADFLLYETRAFPKPSESRRVNTLVLRIRSAPNTAAAVRGTLVLGQMVRVMPDKNGLWYLLADGRGWVHGDYLSPIVDKPPEPPKPAPVYITYYVSASDGINVRSQPKIGNNVVRSVKQNTPLKVDLPSLTNGFVQTDDGNWVYREYLSETKVQPAPPVTPPAIPVPKRKSKSIFGWHVNYEPPIRGLVIPHAQKMLGILGGFTVVNMPDLANELVKMGHMVMYRQYIDPSATYKTSWLDGKTYAEAFKMGQDFYWYGPHRATVVNVDRRCFIKIINECGYHSMDYAFTLGMMQAADEDGKREGGRKLAIFGDSSGTPKTARFDKGIEEWKTRVPALQYAYYHGHVLTLNQYGKTNPDGSDADYRVSDDDKYTFFGGRHIEFYDIVPADARPALIIGETGASNSRKTQPFAVEDGVAYAKKLAAGPYGDKILFHSLYTLAQWKDCRLDGQVPLAERLLTS